MARAVHAAIATRATLRSPRAAKNRPATKTATSRTTPTAPNSDPTWSTSECTDARLGISEASWEDGVNAPGPAPKTGSVAHSRRASDHSVCRAELRLSLAANHDGQEDRFPSQRTASPARTARKNPLPTAYPRWRGRRYPPRHDDDNSHQNCQDNRRLRIQD